MKSNSFSKRDGSNYTFAIVRARFNAEVTEGLLFGALKALSESNVPEKQIMLYEVPGSYDIPYGIHAALKGKKPDAIICLGAIVKGETMHDQVIAHAVFGDLLRLEQEYSVPITLGILTTHDMEQARTRSANNEVNAGYQAVRAAVELLYLG